MTTVLYRGGAVYTPADPYAQAVLVQDGTVAWVGSDEAAGGQDADLTVDLDGALVTPAFVDAHVHVLDVGLMLTGVDAGAPVTVVELLDAVAAYARANPGRAVLGHGWDETRLPEGRPPTRAELDRAAGGADVYLSRVDVHSAVVSSSLAERAGAATMVGWDDSGRVERDAHQAVRHHARRLSDADRSAVHATALRAFAAQGVATVHEMSGPFIGGVRDLQVLVATAADVGVRVVPYWGEFAATPEHVATLVEGLDLPASTRLGGLAGDLSVDGSIGSRTAAFREPYADGGRAEDGAQQQHQHHGHVYLPVDVIAEHVVACVRAGVQPGFHVIGDAGVDEVVAGLRSAAGTVGEPALRRARVRLEHLEGAHREHVEALASLGVVASMQPAFDALWGGPGELYEHRLGRFGRALNKVGSFAAAGVPLAFGSDAPVTAVDPWAGVQAAVLHHDPEQRISARAAFAAHTRGAHRAAFDDQHVSDQLGVLAPGAPATFALWEAGELVVQAPDDRVQAWSTDPRSRTPALPDLSAGAPAPRCLRTVSEGRVVHDSGELGTGT